MTCQPDHGVWCVKVVMVTAPEHPLTYEQFFAEECPRLVPMLHALTGDRGRAEDIAQDALVRAHREWEPLQQRWSVVLHYVEDLSVADVARVLEISEGSVKTHLSRARAALAERLADHHEGDGHE